MGHIVFGLSVRFSVRLSVRPSRSIAATYLDFYNAHIIHTSHVDISWGATSPFKDDRDWVKDGRPAAILNAKIAPFHKFTSKFLQP